MKKKGLLITALIAFGFNLYGQRSVPLFLKDKNFDVVYGYNHKKRTIEISSYIPLFMEANFDKNTFYLKRDSVTIDSRMQYEYFKIDDDKWLEVATINKKSTSRIFKLLEEVTNNDTIPWMKGYSHGVYIFPYNQLDTFPTESIIEKEIKY